MDLSGRRRAHATDERGERGRELGFSSAAAREARALGPSTPVRALVDFRTLNLGVA